MVVVVSGIHNKLIELSMTNEKHKVLQEIRIVNSVCHMLSVAFYCSGCVSKVACNEHWIGYLLTMKYT